MHNGFGFFSLRSPNQVPTGLDVARLSETAYSHITTVELPLLINSIKMFHNAVRAHTPASIIVCDIPTLFASFSSAGLATASAEKVVMSATTSDIDLVSVTY